MRYQEKLNQGAARALWQPEEMTVREVADLLYPGVTYDAALPQWYVNQCIQRHRWNPTGHVVWVFHHTVDGEPWPITQEGVEELQCIEDSERAHEQEELFKAGLL